MEFIKKKIYIFEINIIVVVVPLFQELKGGKTFAKVRPRNVSTISTSGSPRFTVISHICVDVHVGP